MGGRKQRGVSRGERAGGSITLVTEAEKTSVIRPPLSEGTLRKECKFTGHLKTDKKKNEGGGKIRQIHTLRTPVKKEKLDKIKSTL